MSTSVLEPRVARDPGRLLWPVVGGCWLVLVALTVTGGDGAGHHDVVLGSSSSWAGRMVAFLAVWTVMVVAMMLPTITPLVRHFRAVSARAPQPARARLGLYAGYLAVWTLFAPLALLGDAGVHAVVRRTAWLDARPGLVLAGALVLAGGYQFSPLKNACLTACRNPVSFLRQHYRRGWRPAAELGVRHGLSCLGCCWALMLVMFATGVGSLAWMLGLTAVMVVEKTVRWGASLVSPVGLLLLLLGSLLAVVAVVPTAPSPCHPGDGHGHGCAQSSSPRSAAARSAPSRSTGR